MPPQRRRAQYTEELGVAPTPWPRPTPADARAGHGGVTVGESAGGRSPCRASASCAWPQRHHRGPCSPAAWRSIPAAWRGRAETGPARYWAPNNSRPTPFGNGSAVVIPLPNPSLSRRFDDCCAKRDRAGRRRRCRRTAAVRPLSAHEPSSTATTCRGTARLSSPDGPRHPMWMPPARWRSAWPLP